MNTLINIYYHVVKTCCWVNPAIAQGHNGETYWCSFDSLIPDSECLKVMYEILGSL